MFDRFGLVVPEDDVLTLTAWTEGSAAALHLAALCLREGPGNDTVLTEARVGDRTVMDYLLSEVLAQQPEAVRNFILRTAIVDTLNCDLAEAIVETEAAADQLERSARQGLFLKPVGGPEGWYRHDRLIADLLRVGLRHELSIGSRPFFMARAARWYETAGRLDDAMYHAATAHEWDDLARMITDSWLAAALEGTPRPVRPTPPLLPDAVCDGDATRALAAAIQHLERGEHEDASAWLAVAATRDVDGDGDESKGRRRLLATLIWLSLAWEGTGSVGEIDAAATLLEEDAGAGDSLDAREQIARLVMLARAEARLRDGDLHAASELLERVICLESRHEL